MENYFTIHHKKQKTQEGEEQHVRSEEEYLGVINLQKHLNHN